MQWKERGHPLADAKARAEGLAQTPVIEARVAVEQPLSQADVASLQAGVMARARASWPAFVAQHPPASLFDGMRADEVAAYRPHLDYLIRWLLAARDTVTERRAAR